MSLMTQNALLLVNLGTPDSPTPKDVRRYLAEFLSDPRVVAIPALFWQPLLRGIILPLRGRSSAEKYAKIWLAEGSPLAVYTKKLTERIASSLPDWNVTWAMRYGQPRLHTTLDTIYAKAIRRIIVLPLYPQYSTTTTASIEDDIASWKKKNPEAEITLIRDYAQDQHWVAAIAQSLRDHWQVHGRAEKLVFSFHGLPQRVANNGDPYPQRCQASAACITKALGLNQDEWVMGYQSRFGAERWLQPYAEPMLLAMATAKVASFDVICPGFAVDCLETLEEVALGFSETVHAHGAQLRYIPCLNDSQAHADALAMIAKRTRDSLEKDL